MVSITSGKSLKSSGTALTRTHAKRRAAATAREKLENIIDAAFGFYGERLPVEDKRSSRVRKALSMPTVRSESESGSAYLPHVAIYRVGYRNSKDITAR